MAIKPFLIIFFNDFKKACLAILFFDLSSLWQAVLLLYVQHNNDYVVKGGCIMALAKIIKYEGDNSVFVWKSPIEDFNTMSQLIVHENQEAIFFMNGQALDLFGPGRHTLETQNILLIGKALNRSTGDKTPFHCEVYDKHKLEFTKVGEYISFGKYEQDNNASNGKEDIEWLVLAKEGDKVLVISRYALDCQKYNMSDTAVTWETCSLRKWLNETFFVNAFNTDEQNMIQSTTIKADKNPAFNTSPGNNTTDKVFLLSITEVNKYFGTDESKKCVPTDYTISQGADTFGSSVGCCWWWLRSPGIVQNYAAFVYFDGSFASHGQYVSEKDFCVRPTIWIKIS